MIVERKQYGCISVLFVQIGLALYVIVVFLAQTPEGIIKPQILKVQKVATAKQATISAEYAKLATKANNQISIVSNQLINISAVRSQIEDALVSRVVSHIEAKQAGDQILALAGSVVSSSSHSTNTNYAYILVAISIFALYTREKFVKTIEKYFNSNKKINLHTIGIIPRAPTIA